MLRTGLGMRLECDGNETCGIALLLTLTTIALYVVWERAYGQSHVQTAQKNEKVHCTVDGKLPSNIHVVRED